MSERTAEATTTVDEDGIRVEKFTDDAFPVPAVMYELSSTREDPRARAHRRPNPRVVPDGPDRVPPGVRERETGPPTRTTASSSSASSTPATIETVFGIRDDDPDLEGFLGTPVIEHVPVGEEIEDVLGAGDTDAVREVLSATARRSPGMEQPLTAEGENSEPRGGRRRTDCRTGSRRPPRSRRSRRRIRGHGVSRTARGRCGNRSGHPHTPRGRTRTNRMRASQPSTSRKMRRSRPTKKASRMSPPNRRSIPTPPGRAANRWTQRPPRPRTKVSPRRSPRRSAQAE